MAKFCGDCKHCSDEPHLFYPQRRVCLKTHERQSDHFQIYGKTPDAYFTKPRDDIWENSQHAERCKYYASKDAS